MYFFFSYRNFSKFSDGNAVWKRERAGLESSPLASFFTGNEEWQLHCISQLSDETDLCWETLKGAQSTWGAMPVRATAPSSSRIIFEQDASVSRSIALSSAFLFLIFRGGSSPPRCSTKLSLCCLGWVKGLLFIISLGLSGKHHGAFPFPDSMYQHHGRRDLFRVTGHILWCYFCNDDQKSFKRMLKSNKWFYGPL